MSDKKEPGTEWSGKKACQAEETAIAKTLGQDHAQSVRETKSRPWSDGVRVSGTTESMRSKSTWGLSHVGTLLEGLKHTGRTRSE